MKNALYSARQAKIYHGVEMCRNAPSEISCLTILTVLRKMYIKMKAPCIFKKTSSMLKIFFNIQNYYIL